MKHLYNAVCEAVLWLARGLDRLLTRPQGGEYDPQLSKELEEAGYEFIGTVNTDDFMNESAFYIRPVAQDDDQDQGDRQ